MSELFTNLMGLCCDVRMHFFIVSFVASAACSYFVELYFYHTCLHSTCTAQYNYLLFFCLTCRFCVYPLNYFDSRGPLYMFLSVAFL